MEPPAGNDDGISDTPSSPARSDDITDSPQRMDEPEYELSRFQIQRRKQSRLLVFFDAVIVLCALTLFIVCSNLALVLAGVLMVLRERTWGGSLVFVGFLVLGPIASAAFLVIWRMVTRRIRQSRSRAHLDADGPPPYWSDQAED
jgi:hypothetical protein